jgi:hypothetical protein
VEAAANLLFCLVVVAQSRCERIFFLCCLRIANALAEREKIEELAEAESAE